MTSIIIHYCFSNDYDKSLYWVEKWTVYYLDCFVQEIFVSLSKYELYSKLIVIKANQIILANLPRNFSYGDAFVKKII